MPHAEKRKVVELLGDKAIPFALYCKAAATDNAKAVGFLWQSVHEMDLNSSVFKGIVNILLTDEVIDQNVVDRIKAFLGVDSYP